MKIIALGDTHGRSYWKTVVESDTFDTIVFIGDYFDSREFITDREQIRNFRELVAYKKSHPDKVVLLIGNHDFHYLPGITDRYSLYQPWAAQEIRKVLAAALAEDFLQMCYLHHRFLFTHAGVTRTWAKANGIDRAHIQNSINVLFRNRPDAFKFTRGINNSSHGDDICQTPIWVRPASLQQDKLDGYTQVVGHTRQETLRLSEEIIFIDTLSSSGQYLAINDQIPFVAGYANDNWDAARQ